MNAAPSIDLWKGAVALWMLGAATLLGGCIAPAPPEEATRSTLLEPRWRDGALADHLNFLYDAFDASVSPASEPAGAYVRAVMHDAWLQPAVEGRYRLWAAPGRPIGDVGYVAGKNPSVAKEAVLVCADVGGETTAVEAAAMLEVAHLYGRGAQFTLMPERTVIFALWPPGASDDALRDDTPGEAQRGDASGGLRAYLRQPTWQLDRLRAVIYVGLPAEARPAVQALLAEYGIELYRVDTAAAVAASSSAQEAAGRRPAVVQARALAERTHERLRAATITEGKMMPTLGDTLLVPRPGPQTP